MAKLLGSGAGAIRTQTSKPRPPLLQLFFIGTCCVVANLALVPLFTGQCVVSSAADKENTLYESTKSPGIWFEITLLRLCGQHILMCSKT